MIVYLITNKINGKRYIGQTMQTAKARFSKHCSVSSANKGMPIVRAIQKYGKNNFEMKILCRCNSIEEMNHRESYYIKLLNTMSPVGYNALPGGLNSLHTEETKKKIGLGNIGKHIGKKRTQEVRDRMSRDRKGKRRSPDVAKACSERVRGEKHPMFGKHHTQESKNKISKSSMGRSAANKGKKSSEETKRKISQAQMGRVSSVETKNKLSLINSKPDMEVLCHQTGSLYHSTSEAARALNLPRSDVKDVLKGRASHTKGYTFEYTKKENHKKINPKAKKPIICHQNGEIYQSTLEAINKLGVHAPGVYASLRTGKLTKGYSFEYIK
jgi:group I intron endonuclease